MSLTPGTLLGPYEIAAAIGAGGMGEVYRARDTKLNRDVALKVLPDGLARDADRLARFTREAQALAALNHPNVAQIYGIEDGGGAPALVMEFVDGQTLADLVRPALSNSGPGRLSTDDVVSIAREIANGLEAAHEKGIVHRDLKPANVKLTPDGHVKILDFGLAKALSPDPTTSQAMNSPTLTARATEAGVILGTAAYMSPEQARGKVVDKRTDIWAFGAVVYELLTGERAFAGDTVSDALANVLKADPDWTRLPADTPPFLRRLLRRCLERDVTKRLRDIGEARVALEAGGDAGLDVAPAPSPAGAGDTRRPVLHRPLLWMIATVILAAAAVTLFVRRPEATVPDFELTIAPPDGAEFQIGGNLGGVVISPDGAMVAFVAGTPQAGQTLWVRSLANDDAHALPKTDGASYPFWSPDGRRIGFFADGKLRVIDIASGLPEIVADAPAGRGGSWGEDGTIVFTPDGGGSIFRVAVGGGPVEPVTHLDEARGENAHYWPVHLPGSREFLYFVRSKVPENNGIYVTRVDGSGAPTRLVSALSSAVYAPARGGGPGYLLWVREGDLIAQAFDPASKTLTGSVTTVASHVRVEESQRGLFASVSRTGILVWADARAAESELVLYDRQGLRLERLAIEPGLLYTPVFSPDGSRILFMRATNGTADIWLHDISTGTTQQVTTDPDYDEAGTWSPDGRRMWHAGRDQGQTVLMETALDGSTKPRVLVREIYSPGSASPDGRFLLFSRLHQQTGLDGWVLPLASPDAAVALSTEPGNEVPLTVSPDGRWIIMLTTPGGTPQPFLRRFVTDGDEPRLGGARIPLDTSGIAFVWRSDGREILTRNVDGQFLSIPVSGSGDSLSVGRPVPLFALPPNEFGWTASLDGTRFVVAESPRAARQSLRVLTNWDGRR